MHYFAKLTKAGSKGYLVEFPDLPGCLTEGNSLASALKNAEEALWGWLVTRCDLELGVPGQKNKNGKNYYAIRVPMRVEFAIRLRQHRKRKKLSQSEVAKKLGISQQAYAKLELAKSSNPSLLTIQKLSDALEFNIEIKLFCYEK